MLRVPPIRVGFNATAVGKWATSPATALMCALLLRVWALGEKVQEMVVVNTGMATTAKDNFKTIAEPRSSLRSRTPTGTRTRTQTRTRTTAEPRHWRTGSHRGAANVLRWGPETRSYGYKIRVHVITSPLTPTISSG